MDSGKNNQVEKGEFARLLASRTGWEVVTCKMFVEAFWYLVKDILREGKDVCFQNIVEIHRHRQAAQDFHGVAEGTHKPERWLVKFDSHEDFDAYVNLEPYQDEGEEIETEDWEKPAILIRE